MTLREKVNFKRQHLARYRMRAIATVVGVLMLVTGCNVDSVKARTGLMLLESLPVIEYNKGGSALRLDEGDLRVYTHPDHGIFYARKGPDGQWYDAASGEAI